MSCNKCDNERWDGAEIRAVENGYVVTRPYSSTRATRPDGMYVFDRLFSAYKFLEENLVSRDE